MSAEKKIEQIRALFKPGDLYDDDPYYHVFENSVDTIISIMGILEIE